MTKEKVERFFMRTVISMFVILATISSNSGPEDVIRGFLWGAAIWIGLLYFTYIIENRKQGE